VEDGIARVEAFLGEHAEGVVGWVLGSDEPYAAWTLRTLVAAEDPGSPAVREAHEAVLADGRVRSLVDALPDWGPNADESVSGHHSPAYLPNRLNLLADMGVWAGDFDRVEELLDALIAQQDASGHFLAFGSLPGRPKPEWGSLLCDTNVITDVLIRYGRAEEPAVRAALERMSSDTARTPQGRAWQCVPEHTSRWRGPGRKADVCPQVTLEGLRAFSGIAEDRRPAWLLDVARTPLEVWRRRVDERPYMFGHGYQFKSVKWPDFWYDVLWVLETLGRYPDLWRGARATPEDRTSLAELAACLIAYNVDSDGRVTPRRTYRGFEDFSFGQKKVASPFATARVLAALVRFADLAEEIEAVDVAALPGSIGGSGTPVPPKSRGLIARPPTPPPVCPSPAAPRPLSSARCAAHLMGRQHLVKPWEGASVESVVSDLVALHATNQATPYASLFARLPAFERSQLDAALYDRRSLVRFRCMRGTEFLLRREMLPVVFAATSFSVIRHARRHAEFRGVDKETYQRLTPLIFEALADASLGTPEIRERLGTAADVDIAATVNLMCAEGLLLRDRPTGSWLDRRARYVPLARALPDVRLDSVRTDDAVETLVRAYVRGFGPATDQDVSWWIGIGKQRVRYAFDHLEGEIVHITIEGSDEQYMVHAADVDELTWATFPTEPHVVLLPALDPLPMGYASRARMVADAHCPYVFDRSRNMPPTVFVDGRIAGVWDIAAEPAPRVLVHLFEDASSRVREVAEVRARDMGRFWFAEDVGVEFLGSMIPLIDRRIGSFNRPLRP
jgi:hypothetical protein